jgi:hypothetical protein
MTYVAALADEIRREVAPGLVPEGDTDGLFRIYAVLALAKGEQVTAEDVHNAWVAWMGEIDPSHHGLKPFDELPSDVQEQDEPYVRAIRAAAARG